MMEESPEFEGRSLEAALERASKDLGAQADHIRYEVLEDTRSGFLGLGSRRVRIRVVRVDRDTPAILPQENASRAASGAPPIGGKPPRTGAGGDETYSAQESLRASAGRILREMKLELKARIRERDGSLVLELGGTDAALLIERDGEGLDALQHLLNKTLSRDERFGHRVVVDCEGFRERRDVDLVARAREIGARVRRSGKAEHIDGLNPYERRIVHLALAEEGGLRTFSTGDGAIKRLMIEPSGSEPDAK